MLGISGLLNIIKLKVLAVPDPDLVIMGGRSSRPFDKEEGEGWSPKQFFRPFGPQFDLKIRK